MKLPKEWCITQLESLVQEAQSGFASGKRDENGTVQVRMNNITTDGNWDWSKLLRVPASANQLEKYKLQPGDVLVNVTNSPNLVGKAACFFNYHETLVFSNHFVRLRLKRDKINPSYLRQWLNLLWQCRVFEGLCNQWVNQASVRREDLLALTIPLPPLEEQHRIAAILDKADAIRRKRFEAIRLTEELLRAVFLDMFGDPVTNPKGWKVVTVGDIVSDVRDGPHVSPEYSDTGIPILSTRNIRPGRLIMEDIKYISDETYNKLVKQFKPQNGDVLLTKGGTTGFAKTVDWKWPFAIWVHLAALRPKSIVRPEFLEASLNSPSCYQQSLLYTHGIANKDLGLTRIKKIKLCLPPIHIQDEYCRFRQKLYNQLDNQEKGLSESENLFNSLLHRAFKGEL